MAVANTSPPTSTSHIPACTGPALAHSGGPVAVQQRHVTLGGRSGLCHPCLPLKPILVRTSSADLSGPFVLNPTTSPNPGSPFAEVQGWRLRELRWQVLCF